MAENPETETAATPARDVERSSRRGPQSNPENVPDEVRFSADALQEDARGLLGVSTHAVAGALYGQTQKTFTLDEAKKLVDEFLNREES